MEYDGIQTSLVLVTMEYYVGLQDNLAAMEYVGQPFSLVTIRYTGGYSLVGLQWNIIRYRLVQFCLQWKYYVGLQDNLATTEYVGQQFSLVTMKYTGGYSLVELQWNMILIA